MTNAEVILDRLNGTYDVAPLGDHPNTIAVRHTDYKGDVHVVTKLADEKLGKLPLSVRAAFGEKPIVLTPTAFKKWLDAYLGSRSDGLRRYQTLKKVGIPFTGRNVARLLDDSKFQWRASVADLFIKHDLENAGALLNVGKKAGKVIVDDDGGRWLSKRWFAFDTVEDAALVKLTYATKSTAARLIEI